jgi:outer membrane receptor protein involved in Fe transport
MYAECRRGLWAILFSSLVSVSDAQTRNEPAVDAVPDEDETVVLSPFVVNAEDDDGYIASSSLAGSRLDTPLRDTAASINILTAEFLSDIGATDLSEALRWGNNVQLEITDQAANDNVTFESFGDFRVRGIPATVTRNFFPWRMQTDGYNVERIEEQRGPNSILFGIGSAGGVLNQNTKRPSFKDNHYRLGFVVDSYDGFRTTGDFNQELVNDRAALRLNFLVNRQESYRDYVRNDDERVHLAGNFLLTPSTTVRAEYETGMIDQVVARVTHAVDGLERWIAAGSPIVAGAPIPTNATLGITRLATGNRFTYIDSLGMVYNGAGRNISSPAGGGPIFDKKLADWSVNSGGPDSERTGGFETYSVVLEQRLAKRTFVELAYNHQESDYKALVPTIGGSDGVILRGDPHALLVNGQPNPYVGGYFFEAAWGRFVKDSSSDDLRGSLSTEFDAGKWGRYQIAFMAEREEREELAYQQREVWGGAPFNAGQPEGTANQVFRRSYVTKGDWSTYFTRGPAGTGMLENVHDPVTGRTLSSTWVTGNNNIQDDPNTQDTLIASMQARYFSNRLVFTAGVRRDDLKIEDRQARRNATTQVWEVDYDNVIVREYTGETRTLGLVGHATPEISLFVNGSNNFSLPNPTVRILPDSNPAPSPEAEGVDYGFLFSLLDDRIQVRVNRYTLDLVGGHDFRYGGSTSNPTGLNNRILDALIGQGLISVEDADARRTNTTGATFDREVEGYEANVTSNLSRGWSLSLNYSYSDGIESNVGPEVKAWYAENKPFFQSFDQDITVGNGNTIAEELVLFEGEMADAAATEGIGIRGNRKHKFNFFTRYAFSEGSLKGLFVGGGYRYQSKSLVQRTPEDELPYGNSFGIADAVIGYRLPKTEWFKSVSFQLNISNVFDFDDPLITRRDPDGSIDRWAVVAPRSWRLSTNFGF